MPERKLVVEMSEKKIKSVEINEDAALSGKHTLGSLTKLVLPSIFTFVFISVYQVVDGVFIEKYVGPYAMAAVNLYYPVISLILAIGTMMGTGGNAMIVTLLGKGRKDEADKVFSMVLAATLGLSVLLSAVGIIFAEPIFKMLGATEGNIHELRSYYMILTAFAPAIMLQTALGILIIGEGKTVTSGVLIVLSGITNIVLDYVFMKYLGWGTKGSAIATAIGYLILVLYAVYFYSPAGGSKYHFRFVRIDFKKLCSVCINGSSEMISSLAGGITALFMNWMAYKYYGEIGVSVVSVFLYVQFIVMAVFMGTATAVEPLLSYHYGNGNVEMRRSIFRLTSILVILSSIIVTVIIAVFGNQIAGVFYSRTGDAKPFYELACTCIGFSAPACVFTGYNIFASGVFTAFSNGGISALLSGVRTFAAFSICIFGLSALFGANGLWSAWAVAELLSLILSIGMLIKYQKRYFV